MRGLIVISKIQTTADWYGGIWWLVPSVAVAHSHTANYVSFASRIVMYSRLPAGEDRA